MAQASDSAVLRPQRVSLSSELEEKIFGQRLKKREIDALKQHCEAYQANRPASWSPSVLRAYHCYIGYLTALKIKTSLEEMQQSGYLHALESPLRLVDIGAGSLGASLGAMDFFKDNHWEANRLLCVDRSLMATQWAAEEFQAFLPKKLYYQRQLPRLKNFKNHLILMANVWNELSEEEEEKWIDQISQWKAKCEDSTFMILVEPSDRKNNHRFLRLRDRLSQDFSVLLPCTHQKACPALAQGEWCHEEREYQGASRFQELLQQLGFRQSFLSFSYLVLGGQKSRFRRCDARVVSRRLPGKGRASKWLCSDGRRWKESHLTRDKTEENQGFYDAKRGDVLDIRRLK